MKILYVLDSKIIGGMEKYTFDLASASIENGYEVFIVCREGDIADKFRKLKVRVFTSHPKIEIDPFYILSLVKIVKENKIDIVQSNELKCNANAILAIKLFTKAKIYTNIHTPLSFWPATNILIKIVRFFQKVGYAILINFFSVKEIAVNEYIMSIKIKEGLFKRNIIAINNGLSFEKFNIDLTARTELREKVLNEFNIPVRSFIFGCMGRFTEEKNHAFLINAFAKFLDLAGNDRNNFYLFLAGGGLLEDEISELIEKLKLLDRVIVTGVFPDEKQIPFYSTFDAFVFPSKAEGMGYVMLEAMYFGLPVLTSDIPVLKVVAENNNLTFKLGDLDDCAKKLYELYYATLDADKETLNDIRDFVSSRYSFASFVKNYMELYSKI